MKSITVQMLLLLLIPFVLGSGDGEDLPEDKIEEVLALYRKHCKSEGGGGGYSGGGYSDSGSASNSGGGYGYGPSKGPKVNIICKEGREDLEPPRKQVIKIPPSQPQKQILFLEAPTLKVKHNINIIPSSNGGNKIKVYVLPQKASHELKVTDKRRPGYGPSKPQVFFLKNDKSQQQVAKPEYGPPPPQVVVTPTPIYGPPSQGGYQQQIIVNQPQLPIGYGIPSALQFNPASLGPEYEIVAAPQGVGNAYQNILAQIPSGGGGGQQYQIVVPNSPHIPSSSNLIQQSFIPIHLDNTNSGAYINGGGRLLFPSESIQNYQVAKPIVRSSRVKSKLPEADELTDREAEKSIKSLIDAYEKRQTEKAEKLKFSASSTTTTTSTLRPYRKRMTTKTPEPSTTITTTTSTTPPSLSSSTTSSTTPKPTTTSRTTTTRLPSSSTTSTTTTVSPPPPSRSFDLSFLKALITSHARNISSLSSSSSSSSRNKPNNPKLPSTSSYVIPDIDDEVDDTPASESTHDNSRYIQVVPLTNSNSNNNYYNNNNNKRSVMSSSPAFEFFPANFVSYSYSKVDYKK